MNKKSVYFGAMLVTLLLMGNANAASTQSQAQSTRQGGVTKPQDNSLMGSANATKEKFSAERCATVQNQLRTKTNSYNKTNNRNYDAFLNMQARLTKVEARLRLEEGLDTSKLKQDIEKLDALIKTYAKDYSLLNEDLKFTNKKACEGTQGEVQNSLTTAREQVRLVHQDRDKIREFYANFIKPDLMDLKKQLEETATDKDETDTENETPVSNNNQ